MLRFVLTFVAAVLLHTAWDGSDNLVVHVLVALVSVVGLLVVIHRSRRTAPVAEAPAAPASIASATQGR